MSDEDAPRHPAADPACRGPGTAARRRSRGLRRTGCARGPARRRRRPRGVQQGCGLLELLVQGGPRSRRSCSASTNLVLGSLRGPRATPTSPPSTIGDVVRAAFGQHDQSEQFALLSEFRGYAIRHPEFLPEFVRQRRVLQDGVLELVRLWFGAHPEIDPGMPLGGARDRAHRRERRPRVRRAGAARRRTRASSSRRWSRRSSAGADARRRARARARAELRGSCGGWAVRAGVGAGASHRARFANPCPLDRPVPAYSPAPNHQPRTTRRTPHRATPAEPSPNGARTVRGSRTRARSTAPCTPTAPHRTTNHAPPDEPRTVQHPPSHHPTEPAPCEVREPVPARPPRARLQPRTEPPTTHHPTDPAPVRGSHGAHGAHARSRSRQAVRRRDDGASALVRPRRRRQQARRQQARPDARAGRDRRVEGDPGLPDGRSSASAPPSTAPVGGEALLVDRVDRPASRCGSTDAGNAGPQPSEHGSGRPCRSGGVARRREPRGVPVVGDVVEQLPPRVSPPATGRRRRRQPRPSADRPHEPGGDEDRERESMPTTSSPTGRSPPEPGRAGGTGPAEATGSGSPRIRRRAWSARAPAAGSPGRPRSALAEGCGRCGAASSESGVGSKATQPAPLMYSSGHECSCRFDTVYSPSACGAAGPVPDRDARGDAERAGHHGHRGREVHAVPLADLQELRDDVHAVAVVALLDRGRLGVREQVAAEPLLERPGLLVVGRSRAAATRAAVVAMLFGRSFGSVAVGAELAGGRGREPAAVEAARARPEAVDGVEVGVREGRGAVHLVRGAPRVAGSGRAHGVRVRPSTATGRARGWSTATRSTPRPTGTGR